MRLMKRHNQGKWKYKNLTVVFASIILAIVLFKNEWLHSYLLSIGEFGYIGAFIAGILFVSTFTVATGSLILLILAEKLSPIELDLIAGLGAVVGDLLIFRLVKDELSSELRSLYNLFDHKHHLRKLFHSKYFNWTLPVIGAIIIASPLPDEMGVSLMGISKMKSTSFVLVSYILNSIGIFIVISLSAFIKP